jgi:NADH-quinone oxidoreductase subunit J
LDLVSPAILYTLIVLGAVGVCMAMPRRGLSPQIVGAVLAGGAGGLLVLLLSVRAVQRGEGLPNIFFYIFSAVALGASLRVITHPRPVYAALWFILTILASAGLYLILAAEFMAFALVIVYAGAILITYLFVIMLATQAPSREQIEALTEYDAASREPMAATAVGFLLLALLTTVLFAGAGRLPAPDMQELDEPDRLLAFFPRRVERALRAEGLLERGESLARIEGEYAIDHVGRTVVIVDDVGQRREVALPADLRVTNVEKLGFDLLHEHPGSIEIAGVILLMAMLGAVVLARRRVQLEEQEKAEAVSSLESGRGEGGGQ